MESAYVTLTAVTACLSVFGGTVLIVTFTHRRRRCRRTGRLLLVYLSVADGITALGNLLGVLLYTSRDGPPTDRSMTICKCQSAVTIYSSIAAFMWTIVISVCLYMAIVRNNAPFIAKYMPVFHAVSWGIAGVIVVTALSLDVLGQDPTLRQASWCWINTRVDHVLVWQLITGKLWEIIAYVTTVVLYTVIKVFLWKKTKKSLELRGRRTRTMAIQEANVKLTFVPLVFIICRIWGTVRFLLGNFAHDHINEPYLTWINPLQGIGDSAQGFMNFILYCLSTNKIRHRLIHWFCPSKTAPTTTNAVMTHSGFQTQSKVLKRSMVDIADERQTPLDVAKAPGSEGGEGGQYAGPSTSNTGDTSFSHPCK